MRYYPGFLRVVPLCWADSYVLLTRPPLVGTKVTPKGSQRSVTVRLACVRPTASVQSEPGSNSPVQDCLRKTRPGGREFRSALHLPKRTHCTQLFSESGARAPTQSACKLLKIGAHPVGLARRGADYTDEGHPFQAIFIIFLIFLLGPQGAPKSLGN